jgi:hypothetical protein
MKPTHAAAILAAVALAACSREAPPRPPLVVAQPSAPAKPVDQEPMRGAPPVENAKPPVFANAHPKVGPEVCKTCHRPQHTSWSASPHAAKGIDCEGCHGGGADYVKVMRDRNAAYAAGLVMPKRALCRACHKDHWHDDMYLRAHAHVHEVK